MELRHLRYFVAVAQELHFGRAARRLNISQPPLTQQINNLEQELGVRLFDRSNRKVTLTKEGSLFLNRAESILHQSERAMQEVRKSARGEMDTVVIGYMGSVVLREITGLLQRFHKLYPLINLELIIMRSDEQYEALVDGKIDAGFVDLSVQPMSDRFHSHHVNFDLMLHERLWVAVCRDHPFADWDTISIADLKNENFVTLQRHLFPSHYDKVVSKCEQAGFSPSIVAMSDQTDVLLTYVAAGVGVALVPECTMAVWGNDAAFIRLDQVSYVDVHLITNADHQSPSVRVMRDIFVEMARERLNGTPAS